MRAEEHRGLGLLIVLTSSGCLGLPRYTEDDGGDDASDGPGPTTAVVDEGPGPEGPGELDGPGTTSVNDDALSFVFMPDMGRETVTTTSVSDVTTDPPPPPEACQAYSALVTECYGAEYGENSFNYCVEYLDYLAGYTPQCVPFFEEYLVCISELSCGELSSGEFCETEIQKFSECQGG